MFLSLCLSLALACVEQQAPPTRPDVVYYQTQTFILTEREYTAPSVVAALPEPSDCASYSRLASNDSRREGLRCTSGVA